MAFFKKIINKLFHSNKENEIDKKKKKLKEKHLNLVLKSEKFQKYEKGLSQASDFGKQLLELQNKHLKLDEEYFENLEEILIMSDINVSLVDVIIEQIKKEIRINKITDIKLIGEIIADKIFEIYTNNSIIDTSLDYKNNQTNVFFIVGVNGSGKTTSIAKLANYYKSLDKKVLIAAADTFRAGAVEQLRIWSEKIGCDIVMPKKANADPSSVIYEAAKKAKDEAYDLLIIDTAGRLQNKVNLMNELKKMYEVLKRFLPEAPNESLLVLDATNGQSGIMQAKVFKEVVNLSGIILTKMDGTSKGGIVLSIKDELDLNVKLVGLGEKLDDLQEFDLELFIYQMTKSLLQENV